MEMLSCSKMASNCDVQDCVNGVKDQKMDVISSDSVENNMKMEINSFGDKFYSPSKILEGKIVV